MKRLDTLVVDHTLHDKHIEIVEGDLANMSMGEDVDILIISAGLNDYAETSTSVIGALARKGLHVRDLATDKELDLRRDFSCWLSKQIDFKAQGLRFSRVLCYEHVGRYPTAAEGVEDIFRALAPFLGSEPPISSVAMPLIGCGDQGFSVAALIEPLVDAAMRWMRMSTINRVRIVEFAPHRAKAMAETFRRVKERIVGQQMRPRKHDFFLSYSHADKSVADRLEETLACINPGIRVFRDVASLRAGRDYFVQLDQAIRESAKFLQLLSPSYVSSKSCQDEFNVAWSFSQMHDREFILPQLVTEEDILEPRMSRLQYDNGIARGSIDAACERMVKALPEYAPRVV